jgi:peptidoglycan/LPS O-acetylase OafA/YrhL
VAARLPPAAGEAAYLGAALLAVIAASALSYHLVERPVLRRRDRAERWLAGRAPAG